MNRKQGTSENGMPVEPALCQFNQSQIGNEHAQEYGEKTGRQSGESEGASQRRQRKGKANSHAKRDAQGQRQAGAALERVPGCANDKDDEPRRTIAGYQ